MFYTAKSFQKYPIDGEPFEQNKKMYVNIRYADGHLRAVRAYSEQEYIKMYPEDNLKPTKLRSTKEVLGFTKGYITIFQEPISEDDEEWLQMSSARYHTKWKWYFVSDEELPQLPCGLRPRELKWEDVADVKKDELRSEREVLDAVATVLYEESPSQFQGAIGDRIDRTLTVTRIIPIDNGRYGPSNFYLFTDGTNIYSWQTAARQLEVGETYFVRGTVKEHRLYKREAQTVLTRCQIQ